MVEHAPLPPARPVETLPATVAHPDNNQPASSDKSAASRQARVRVLSETFRERLVIGLLNQQLAAEVIKATLDVLQNGSNKERVPLLTELLKHVPGPGHSPAERPQSNVVAIQVNAALRRGKKEYA